MIDARENTKRIAKNTIFLYIRMLVMMVVSLFTFRELLKEIGVDDYGTYNVVGGVVILFSFLSNALTQSNQRFLSYEIGKGNMMGGLNKVFSMIVNVQMVIASVIIILAETIGLWFINTQLNFEGEKMSAVNYVYQFSILTFVIQILQIPYTSAIIAHERMSLFSYISIGEALLRLSVVLVLGLFASGRLVLYACLLSISTLLIWGIYFISCNKLFPGCRYIKIFNRTLFRQLTSFSGWNMLGGLGNVGASQGVNFLFNIFNGVIVNAAMGVAHQVAAAVNSLVSNMQVAFNPQIIKSYAAGEIPYFISLINRSARLSFYLIYMIGLPLIFCMPTILDLWLTDIPDYTIPFTRIIIIFCMVDVLSGPLWTANQAVGRVKIYMITVFTLTLLNVPVAYLLLKHGISPTWVMWVKIILNICTLIFRIMYLKISIDFPAYSYIKNVVLKVLTLVMLSLPYPILCHSLCNSLSHEVIFFASMIVVIGILGFFIMLTRNEQIFLLKRVKLNFK